MEREIAITKYDINMSFLKHAPFYRKFRNYYGEGDVKKIILMLFPNQSDFRIFYQKKTFKLQLFKKNSFNF